MLGTRRPRWERAAVRVPGPCVPDPGALPLPCGWETSVRAALPGGQRARTLALNVLYSWGRRAEPHPGLRAPRRGSCQRRWHRHPVCHKEPPGAGTQVPRNPRPGAGSLLAANHRTLQLPEVRVPHGPQVGQGAAGAGWRPRVTTALWVRVGGCRAPPSGCERGAGLLRANWVRRGAGQAGTPAPREQG